jgi:hypothetical protein
MDLLNQVGLNQHKEDGLEWIKLSELTKNKRYNIVKVRRSASDYGEQVVIESDSFQVGLPQRFSVMEDLQLEQLVGKKFYFSGKLGKTHLVQFE